MSLERTPPYLQVVATLKAQIVSGELKHGDTLPSVRDLAARYEISTATAQKVHRTLKAEGLAEAKQGSATTVSTRRTLHRTAADRLESALNTGRIYADGEYAVITGAGLADPPEWVADLLGTETSGQALRRERVTHNSDDQPVSASVSWFSADLADTVPALLVQDRIVGGTPSAIEAATGRRAVATEEATTAAAATQEQAALLGVTTGEPVLLSRNVYVDAQGDTIEVGEAVAPAGRWRVHRN
ncbi:GntR family transcriptional regulator [Streptomyces olivaceus]|uniref:GntR family transcriptional regulator n=2 Tax=Streptomyces olivaceus TaxID=47716 RepID=UPI001CC9634F|nr:GntR family transcriptional regulator [Streptomyces olivaceus]MBZ6086688.1 GntR family transcriptional regulator [Streptomyces olivaceus]MBZ6296105.1 GntR family transcriptional regulator [Streptomyces olivaceus]